MNESLRVLIIGAGGTGAFYGARLQTAVYQLTYVAASNISPDCRNPA